jgi:hypothetical protein
MHSKIILIRIVLIPKQNSVEPERTKLSNKSSKDGIHHERKTAGKTRED